MATKHFYINYSIFPLQYYCEELHVKEWETKVQKSRDCPKFSDVCIELNVFVFPERGRKISEWHLVIWGKNPSLLPTAHPHIQFSSFRIKSKLFSLKSPFMIWPHILILLHLSIFQISLYFIRNNCY